MCAQQVFQDGLAEAQKYLDMGETPPGFAVMPASPDAGPEEGPAKASKRSGSAKTRDGGPVGPGISKDAGESFNTLSNISQPEAYLSRLHHALALMCLRAEEVARRVPTIQFC